ncbi:MAG TPA: Gfo/Idh/MocA family oxidoreductase [Chryseosolibacter sp.]
MKRFALIGAAGYIAPRHMKAIKETENLLVAALDKHDNVGILDSYFPEADFFTEFERFDRHLDKLKRGGAAIDYVSICSPNYLHDSHIRFALRQGADAICEKPLVLNPWNVDALSEIERETNKKVFTILQLRLHPQIIKLKERVDASGLRTRHAVNLKYVTARGNWYHISWKGEMAKSGGIVTNIGIHFFDMLIWIFGPVKNVTVDGLSPTKGKGFIELEKADVTWDLSIDVNDVPENARKQGKRTYRSLTLAGEEVEFSDGFTDLHTRSYQEILKGNGFGLVESKPAIELVNKIRNGGR